GCPPLPGRGRQGGARRTGLVFRQRNRGGVWPIRWYNQAQSASTSEAAGGGQSVRKPVLSLHGGQSPGDTSALPNGFCISPAATRESVTSTERPLPNAVIGATSRNRCAWGCAISTSLPALS